VTILPVIVGPCSFKHTRLGRFQAVNDPSRPLGMMGKYEKDEVWTKVIEAIWNANDS
jgi:hypothetical protein